ncbi:MAG: hypothetical protein K2G41_11180 [Duncaniella sp.]|uniref:hypothetical protein n=1 Tax=Duncaniella sp. TaxID=2518496 RepID=UPI0023D33823|nr:hypothetical protein [Duncaniella sp.]MDE6091247.1 hypothetical protein [Duncaniella sp.]
MQVADFQGIKVVSFVEFVRQICEIPRDKDVNEYALKSFLTFMLGWDLKDVTTESLTNWIATLFVKGNTATTVKRYLTHLHVTFVDWQKNTFSEIQFKDPFKGLRPLVDSENQTKSDEVQLNYNLIKRLKTADAYKEQFGKWKAIFFYLLYNPEMSIEDLANLNFTDVPRYCPQSVEIVESMDSSRGRKYVFALDQPNKRITQIIREINENVGSLTRMVGMKFEDGFSRERITAIWIFAALKSGVRIDEIRAIVPVIPNEFKILEMVSPSQLSDRDRQDIICRVANRINDITTRWYVVNMRDRITPDAVKDSIKENFPSLFSQIHFFYPTHYIYREGKNKKKVKVEVPYIPGLLFIKVKSDRVGSVMNSVRNIAWGYKQLNTPDSPYSVISQRAMTDFQKHIGMFTEDVRMEMVTQKEPLAVNDSVIIHGDSIDGSIGEITEIKEKNGIKTYSIRLTHNQSFNWSVKIDDELRLEPLSTYGKKVLTEYA